MENNLDEKDTFRLITQIESKHDNEIKSFGNESWPIVRIWIIKFLQNEQNQRTKLEQNSIKRFSYYSKIQVDLSQLGITNNFYGKEILESENIFF